MINHTPGPWTRGYGNYVYEGNRPDEQGPLIATCYPLNGTSEELEEAFANAQLIAVAPTMLALLEAISTARAKQDHEFDVDAWYAQVRATIAELKREEI